MNSAGGVAADSEAKAWRFMTSCENLRRSLSDLRWIARWNSGGLSKVFYDFWKRGFQIIWRLWKSGTKKRILFLVDRNILADQTKTNDFKPFGTAMTKITNRTVDKAFEIYLSLYQAILRPRLRRREPQSTS